MSLQTVNIGAFDFDKSADTIREGGDKINDNFAMWRDDVAAVLADTRTYSDLAEGDVIRSRKEGYAYEVAASDATSHHIATAGGVKLYVLPISGLLPLCAFGAVGDGTTDDTDAIDAAIQAMFLTGHGISVDPPTRGNEGNAQTVYVYDGLGAAQAAGINKTPKIVSTMAAQDKVKIRIDSDVYLLRFGDIVSLHIEGIEFEGGRGVFVQRDTDGNVQDIFEFRRCTFRNWTECAMGSNSVDMPNWRIIDNTFFNTDDTRLCFALSGLTDGCVIRGNTFFGGMCKVAWGGNNAYFSENFWPTARVGDSANVWFVPRAAGSNGVNVGAGCIFYANKFGNEYLDIDAARRILIAAEATSETYFYERRTPSFAATDEWIDLPTFIGNLFSFPSNDEAFCVIECWAQRIRNLYWDASNMIEGSAVGEVLRVPDAVTLASDADNLRGVMSPPVNRPGTRMVNRPEIARILDPGQLAAVDYGVDAPGRSGRYSGLARAKGSAASYTDASGTAVPGSMNSQSNDAEEITFSAGTGLARFQIATTNFVFGQPLRVSLDLSRAAAQSLDRVEVEIFRRVGGSQLRILRPTQVILTDDWVTLAVSLMPKIDFTDQIQVHVTPLDWETGVKDRVRIDNLHVYHDDAVLEAKHQYFYGAARGQWNGPHVVFGSPSDASAVHLWVNGADIRASVGEPASATDGALIGTAT